MYTVLANPYIQTIPKLKLEEKINFIDSINIKYVYYVCSFNEAFNQIILSVSQEVIHNNCFLKYLIRFNKHYFQKFKLD